MGREVVNDHKNRVREREREKYLEMESEVPYVRYYKNTSSLDFYKCSSVWLEGNDAGRK